MLSGYPLPDSKFKNYQHTLFSHPDIRDDHFDNINMFDAAKDLNLLIEKIAKSIAFYTENIYDEEVVKMLYERRDDFDLMIIDRLMSEVRTK